MKQLKLSLIAPFILGLSVCSPSTAILAQQQNPSQTTLFTNAIRAAFDSEKITVIGTAVTLTASKINPNPSDSVPALTQASMAACSLETGDIRVLTTGTAPTSTTGFYVISPGNFIIYGYTNLSAFQAIRVTSTSGILNCTYYR